MKKLTIILIILVLLSLACGTSGNNGNNSSPIPDDSGLSQEDIIATSVAATGAASGDGVDEIATSVAATVAAQEGSPPAVEPTTEQAPVEPTPPAEVMVTGLMVKSCSMIPSE